MRLAYHVLAATESRFAMHIAIIGSGAVGQALGRAISARGQGVTFGSRDPAALRAVTRGWTSQVDVARPAAAAASAEIIILALPWRVAEAAVRSLGTLAGKIVIDCMNPIAMGPDGIGLALGHTSSGGEAVQGWLPEARVVKTLNQVGAEVMADTSGFARPPLQFIAGDDPDAKETVAQLLADLGFQPLDAGNLAKARLLEPLALTWINQSLARGLGRDWAFAALPRTGASA
jgi:8-hydroxy-5-deazaflavin:NADPH oxidoreductase